MYRQRLRSNRYTSMQRFNHRQNENFINMVIGIQTIKRGRPMLQKQRAQQQKRHRQILFRQSIIQCLILFYQHLQIPKKYKINLNPLRLSKEKQYDLEYQPQWFPQKDVDIINLQIKMHNYTIIQNEELKEQVKYQLTLICCNLRGMLSLKFKQQIKSIFNFLLKHKNLEQLSLILESNENLDELFPEICFKNIKKVAQQSQITSEIRQNLRILIMKFWENVSMFIDKYIELA